MDIPNEPDINTIMIESLWNIDLEGDSLESFFENHRANPVLQEVVLQIQYACIDINNFDPSNAQRAVLIYSRYLQWISKTTGYQLEFNVEQVDKYNIWRLLQLKEENGIYYASLNGIQIDLSDIQFHIMKDLLLYPKQVRNMGSVVVASQVEFHAKALTTKLRTLNNKLSVWGSTRGGVQFLIDYN